MFTLFKTAGQKYLSNLKWTITGAEEPLNEGHYYRL
jgi:hypothetical protein